MDDCKEWFPEMKVPYLWSVYLVYFMVNPIEMDDDWGYPYDSGDLKMILAYPFLTTNRHMVVNGIP